MMINDIMRMEFLKRTVWAKVLEQINVFLVQKYKLKRNNYDERYAVRKNYGNIWEFFPNGQA